MALPPPPSVTISGVAPSIRIPAEQIYPATSEVRTRPAVTTSPVVIAANTLRVGLSVFNDSPETLYLDVGAAPSSTSFRVRIEGPGLYELPMPNSGQVQIVWGADAGGGRACINETSRVP